MVKRKRSSCQGVQIVEWRHFEVEGRTLATKIFAIPVRVHEYCLCNHPSRLGFTLLNFSSTLCKWKRYICRFFKNALHTLKMEIFSKKRRVVDLSVCPVIKLLNSWSADVCRGRSTNSAFVVPVTYSWWIAIYFKPICFSFQQIPFFLPSFGTKLHSSVQEASLKMIR